MLVKNRVGLITVALALTACQRANPHPAESYQRWTDRMIARLSLPNVGIWPCEEQAPTDECFKMQPPRRWRGIWVLGPGEEDERFCPNSVTVCPWKRLPRYDLEWNRRVFTGRPQVHAEWGKSYVVDFTGRRTTYESGWWSSDPDYTVVVDRLNSMRMLNEPKDAEAK